MNSCTSTITMNLDNHFYKNYITCNCSNIIKNNKKIYRILSINQEVPKIIGIKRKREQN